MKNMTKAGILTSATSLILGLGLTASSAYGLWSDSDSAPIEAGTPFASIDMTVQNGGSTKLVDPVNGTVSVDQVGTDMNDYARNGAERQAFEPGVMFGQNEFLTNDDYVKLVSEHKLAKAVTVDAKTVGEIGLNNYSTGFTNIDWSKKSDTGLSLTGPLLSKTDKTKNRIVEVSSPDQCSTNILDTENTVNSYDNAIYNRAGNQSTSNADGFSTNEVSVGKNQERSDTLCMVLSLPEKDESQNGKHTNTVTVDGESADNDEKVSAKDSWSANVVPGPIDYNGALTDQQNEKPVRVATFKEAVNNDSPELSRVGNSTRYSIYNPGQFDYNTYRK